MQLIIPMSGIGKRFIDAGYKTPKPLIEVDGIPIIKHVLNLFNNPNNVIFICNEKHLIETNMREILNEISPNCKIHEVPDKNRKGPVDAVLQASELISDDDEIIISYCDYGTEWDFNGFLSKIKETNCDGIIPCYTGFHPHMLGSDNYAFLKINGDTVISVQEKKPFTENKMSELASNGTYYFKNGKLVKKYFKKLISLGESINNEYYVSLVYNLLISDGLNIKTYLIEKMLQWGTPYDLENYVSWSDYFRNLSSPQKKIKNPKNTTLLLPMAGNGSRFLNEGYNLPKPLIDVDGDPMVVQAVNCLPQSDKNVFMCLNDHIKNYNIDKIVSSNFKNTTIVPIKSITEGQACTCEIGIKESNIDLELPIFISACDNGVYYDTNEYTKLLNDESIDVIVWSFRNNQASKTNPDAYAWLDVDENNTVKHVSCKKFIYDNPLTTHAIIGSMFFRKSKYFMDGLTKNYKENIRTNGEFYVDDVLNQNINMGLNVKVFEVKNYICWGTPNDYKTYMYWRDFFDNCKWHPYKNKIKK